jgi:hypothetical protein
MFVFVLITCLQLCAMHKLRHFDLFDITPLYQKDIFTGYGMRLVLKLIKLLTSNEKNSINQSVQKQIFFMNPDLENLRI